MLWALDGNRRTLESFRARLLLIQCNEKMKDNKTALTLLFENVD